MTIAACDTLVSDTPERREFIALRNNITGAEDQFFGTDHTGNFRGVRQQKFEDYIAAAMAQLDRMKSWGVQS